MIVNDITRKYFFFYLSILFKKNKIGNKNSQVNNITTLINVLFSVFLLAYIQDYMTNNL